MIRLKSLLKESILNELEFDSQRAFDAYQTLHNLRANTKVKIAGKNTTAGQAWKLSSKPDNKGKSVFKGKGSDVFHKKPEKGTKVAVMGKGVATVVGRYDDTDEYEVKLFNGKKVFVPSHAVKPIDEPKEKNK